VSRAASRPLRILVAEDNHVNRQFVTRVLQKRGHSVVTVANGRLAVNVAGSRSFDVVLMDVQMPEIDGLSATRLIRHREAASGVHVPIVAMTAHAMAGDRERCLDAGMNDYVSKPVHPHELVEAVERAVEPQRTDRVDRVPVAHPGAAVVFDREAARTRLGGDDRLLREMIAIFRTESPGLMAAVKRAAASNDLDGLRQAAHTLRGALGTVRAPLAYDAATRLEGFARQREASSIPVGVADLEREMTSLAQALAPKRRPTAGRKVAPHASPSRRRRAHPRRRR
jgi:two-component system, sensor histidine kinase and response regulator